MKINMTSKDGVTLLTKGKYCTENIEVTPTFETGGETAEVVTKYAYTGGTTVPNTGTISNVYFNIGMSIEEVVSEILSAGLTWAEMQGVPIYGILATTADNTPISALGIADFGLVVEEENAFLIMDMLTGIPIFVASEAVSTVMELGFTGWSADIVNNNGVLPITGELTTSLQLDETITIENIGAENDKLVSLVSTTEWTKEVAETMSLSGVYDGSEITSTKKIVDIKALLNQKKLPLSCVVNIPLQTKVITPTNSTQTFKPDEGYDGLSQVTVDLTPSLQTKRITENGTYTPNEGYVGFNYVTVDSLFVSLYYINVNVKRIENHAYYSLPADIIQVPGSIEYMGTNVFDSSFIKTIIFNDDFSYPDFPMMTFANCWRLVEVKVPSSIIGIDAWCFINCKALKKLDFSSHTVIPTASGSSILDESLLQTDFKIIVPDALYDEWIVDAVWSRYASCIVKASEYTE